MNQPQTIQPPTENQPKIKPWLLITLIVVILVAAGYFGWYFMVGPGKKVETVPTPTVSTSSTPTTATSSTPTITSTATAIVTTTPPTTTPTTDPAAWKKYKNNDYVLTFDYPGNWTVGYVQYSNIFRIASGQKCIDDINNNSTLSDDCQVISINNAASGSSYMAASEQEAALKKNSYYIPGNIISGDINVRTYFSSAYNNLEAYFGTDCNGKNVETSSQYHITFKVASGVNKNDTIETMKKILATVAITPYCP